MTLVANAKPKQDVCEVMSSKSVLLNNRRKADMSSCQAKNTWPVHTHTHTHVSYIYKSTDQTRTCFLFLGLSCVDKTAWFNEWLPWGQSSLQGLGSRLWQSGPGGTWPWNLPPNAQLPWQSIFQPVDLGNPYQAVPGRCPKFMTSLTYFGLKLCLNNPLRNTVFVCICWKLEHDPSLWHWFPHR